MAARNIPAHSPEAGSVISFGSFELDLRSGELRKNGLKLKLTGQPFQVLSILLERPGEVVAREELQKRLWSADTFVDFDHSLNTAINRIREALGDSADNPRFVETLPRRGYRFIAPVKPVGAGLMPASSSNDAAPAVAAGLSRQTERGGVKPPLPSPGDAAPVPFGHPQGVPVQRPPDGVVPVREPLPPHRWSLRLVGLAAMVLVGTAAGWYVWHQIRPQTGQVAPGTIRSLAVLPLENLSGDPTQEYFADGMTEELITDLGQIAALRVISMTSVMRYKGAKQTLPQIARELGVDAIAEGSVEREGSRVRITARLVEAETDRNLWAHSYDRDLTSVLALQGEVAQAIANEIKIKVTPEEQARLARARPVNPEADELYLVGRYFLKGGDLTGTSGTEDLAKAIGYLQQAIEKDPSHAQAHAALAEAYVWLGETTGAPSLETFHKAKAEAAKAVELDDALAEGYAAFAAAVVEDWEWATAEREFNRALELNPNSAAVHAEYADYLAQVGRPQEAISEAKLPPELDPLSLRSYFGLGLHYYFARQYDQALEQIRKILELDPHAAVQWLLGVTYREKGMYEEAIREFHKMGDHPYALAHLGNAYARAGRVAEARATISNLKERLQKENVTYGIALVYAGLGEKDEVFAWLGKAYQVRDKGLTALKFDPCLDPLRSDPRFQDLLRRVGLPP